MKTKTIEKLYALDAARKAAVELVVLLKGTYQQAEIAGSIRRGVAKVHDIDLVVWPVCEFWPVTNLLGETGVYTPGPLALLERARAVADPGTAEGLKPEAKILRLRFQGFPVEMYLAEPDGSNWAALLQMRTGSAGHNAWLARRAQERGLSYRAGYGVYDGAQRVDDGTEAGVYLALGLVCPLPGQRN